MLTIYILTTNDRLILLSVCLSVAAVSTHALCGVRITTASNSSTRETVKLCLPRPPTKPHGAHKRPEERCHDGGLVSFVRPSMEWTDAKYSIVDALYWKALVPSSKNYLLRWLITDDCSNWTFEKKIEDAGIDKRYNLLRDGKLYVVRNDRFMYDKNGGMQLSEDV